ncbi:alpha/beta-hydrolase [Piedraia hortae CBS 480.64]|uniref:Alpha/beta-hydrolase n=1 Tax=Piedraia hortae CBS 480.64 TaxID=1314780 RepID=A0A6A7C8M2_9PEZI|nr:alpha/beta-hydrolase [Piedraia hortae CBS 480.64]
MGNSYTTEEGSLVTPDGQELYTKTWRPVASIPVKARLVFLHGFSDHCNFHGPLFPTLAHSGIITYTFDQRGWGRSALLPQDRGKCGGTQQVMDDISFFVRHTLSQQSDQHLPLFMMGHSMGGQETLYYAAAGPKDILSKIRGFIVEAPFVALHPKAQPFRITVMLGRVAAMVLPHMQKMQKLDSSTICRDEEVAQAFDNDPLCHNMGTLAGLAGMLDRARALETGTVRVMDGVGEGGKTRLLITMGTDDQICSWPAVQELFKHTAVEDKELKMYEGWYHKLHLEPGKDKDIACADMAKWILDRCEGGSRMAAKL